jgi:hypothetical protein
MPDITIAMRALERAIATMPQTGNWRALVANRVTGLREAYVQEVECSPSSDAFALDSAPWIYGPLQLLRRDQLRIVDELEALTRACIEAIDMEALRIQLQLAMQRISRLRQRENDLIYESVDLDLGGEQ